ncbi:MAG: hypothetical protein ACPGEG_07265 [Salibacteraceae bacterium]
MENPTFFHLLTFLYIGYAKISNSDIPLEQEMSIKRKIAQWLDLSFRNVDQYEMIMKESLAWFNSVPEKQQKAHLLMVANKISKVDDVDDIVIKKVLSEIRDIAVSNGLFQQSEKILHDELAKVMGVNIKTVDDHCGPLENLPKSETDKKTELEVKPKGSIGFRYGLSTDKKKTPAKNKPKLKPKSTKKNK